MLARFVTRALQRYWRWSRGLTLGAQGCVLTPDNRILLIRHGYRPGWHFPGGGVEFGEPVKTALARELQEEAGVVLNGEPELFGVYDNGAKYPGDHIVLFVVRAWEQPAIPPPTQEIAEQGYFSPDALPVGISQHTADRIAEVILGRPRQDVW